MFNLFTLPSPSVISRLYQPFVSILFLVLSYRREGSFRVVSSFFISLKWSSVEKTRNVKTVFCDAFIKLLADHLPSVCKQKVEIYEIFEINLNSVN